MKSKKETHVSVAKDTDKLEKYAFQIYCTKIAKNIPTSRSIMLSSIEEAKKMLEAIEDHG